MGAWRRLRRRLALGFVRLPANPRRARSAHLSGRRLGWGAEIAAQTALIISDANYARRLGVDPGMERESLRGVVPFCGPYDPTSLNFEGPFADFMRTVIWSYIGTPNPRDARVAQCP
jgi:hypothetical protein